MAGLFDQLAQQITANTDAEAAAVACIQGIADQLKTWVNGTDPNILAGMISQLETSRAALAAAIVANTPAAPAPTTAPATTTTTADPAHPFPGSDDPGAVTPTAPPTPHPQPAMPPDGGAG
ncbi:MAG TPA: hypothetical protein VEW68_05420 [Patescibacteria group bacterium]|nr:hypothetical protein [Patescibacteria group bacterium]